MVDPHAHATHRPQGPDETPDVSHIENPDTKHEESDVSGTALMKFIGVLLVSILIILGLMKWMSNYFEAREQALELPPASRVNPPGTQRLPPMPRLQGAPGSQELPLDESKLYREEQNAKVASYGWVNKESGVVRIPVNDAMKLILEKGMPMVTGIPPAAPTAPAAPVAGGTSAGQPASPKAPSPSAGAPAHKPTTNPRTK